jgi:DNA polymerase-3 subunit alpha
MWIENLGLKNKKATEKFVPEDVFRWNTESLSILLGKMWQGDGCISIQNEQIYYATSSEKMATQVQHLLLRLGILSTIHSKQFKYRGTKKTGWTIVVTHRENFGKFSVSAGKYLIGRKKEELKNLCEKSSRVSSHAARGTTDTVPAEIIFRIKKIMKEKSVSPKMLSSATGLAPRLFFTDKRKIGYQREVIRIIGKALGSDEIMNYGNSNIFWDEVKSVKKIGIEMTYDIEMPELHNFVANDIIVHNSHAASYGKVAYQTAYMKANFPAIYMSAVLTADSGDVEKISEIITECTRMNIPVLPPSINESFSGFTVVKPAVNGSGSDKIRFGLTTIKNFGEGIADIIIAERKKGDKFKSLGNFLDRIRDRNLNKKSLEALIKAGAMDEFGERGQMLANVENMLSYNKEKAKASDNQESLFGASSEVTDGSDFMLVPATAATQTEKLVWEKELLGLYISGHPLDKFKSVLEKRDITIARVKTEMKEGMIAVLGGIIEEAKPILTKKNDQMMFLRLADLTGAIEVVVFPRVFEEFKKFLVAEKCIVIKGKISNRNDEISLIAEKIKELA